MTPFLLAFAINSPPVKYAILALTTPLWWPFVRALWTEFNDILADEGGLLGREPDEEQQKQVLRERAKREAALVRELRDAEAFAPKRRPDMGSRAGFGPPRPRSSAPAPAPRRRGFGPPR